MLAHARALLTSTPEGRTAYISADLREPYEILADPVVAEILDLRRPVALMLVGIVHFLLDSDQPADIVRMLTGALPSGSYLAATHATAEYSPEAEQAALDAYRNAGVPFQFRSADEFADVVFTGLQMVGPGIVLVSEWRPDDERPRPMASEVGWHGAAARKP